MVTVWKRLISFQQYDKARLPAVQVILLKVGATPGYTLGTLADFPAMFFHICSFEFVMTNTNAKS